MIVVSGAGHAAPGLGGTEETCDPLPYIRQRKSRKFMGVQDDLAVVAAGRALAQAGLSREDLGLRAGLYLSVGFIPFEEADIAPVLASSLSDGEFSMERFGRGGFQRAHPLLTFRCLPNMPAYHVSASFDVRGPYLVAYPSMGPFALALEEALFALEEREIDVALVGGTAHQRNFLVEHHFERLVPPVPRERLRDLGAFLILEREEDVVRRGGTRRARLASLHVSYTPFNPSELHPPHEEVFSPPLEDRSGSELGPAALAYALSRGLENGGFHTLLHRLRTRDGFVVESRWER